MEGYVHLFFNF